MKLMSFKNFNWFACAFFGARIFAAETNSVSPAQPADATAQNALNAYLQIQEQLHATQLSVEKSREEAAVAARRNADDAAARIQLLEQNLEQKIAAQRNSEVEMAQKNQQLTLTVAGAFGAAGLAVLLHGLFSTARRHAVRRIVRVRAGKKPRAANG